ncbi:META domain-containing protein [Hymenobacter aerophilus]|uniref:META domain-containing protein n=1 Tax=Hymenobacter aerophilus TaxID=119644 RepID=UPI0003795AB9|nr:META domain-containing protein [Hymenobacter aerophilus]
MFLIRSTFGTLLTALLLAGCADSNTGMTSDPAAQAATTAAPDPAALAGQWRILTLNGTALPPEAAAEASLNFDTATNKVSGSTGCNRLMGTYATSGAGLTFGPLATTRMACPPNSPEAGLLAALGSKTLTYQLSAEGLTLLEGTTPVVTLSR